jgi:hypothetical protein
MQFQYLLGSFSVLGQCSQGLLSKFGRLRPEASRFRKFPFTNFTRFFSYMPIYFSMAATSPNKRELSVCRYTCLNQIPTSPTKRLHSPGISKRILQPVPHSFSRAPQRFQRELSILWALADSGNIKIGALQMEKYDGYAVADQHK